MTLTQKEIHKLHIKRWEKLDQKQEIVSKEIDSIYRCCAVGQAPPIFHKKCDSLVKIAEEKAAIWNKIRNYVIPNTNRTLWQSAIKKDELLHSNGDRCIFYVKEYGVESGIDFKAQDIINLYDGGL